MNTNHLDPRSRHFADRRVSRRRVLTAGGTGFVGAALVAVGLARATTAAQDATPGASPPGGHVPDLTGVAPRPLTGERLVAQVATPASSDVAGALTPAAGTPQVRKNARTLSAVRGVPPMA